MSFTIYPVQLGVATEVESTLVLLDNGIAGDPSAARRLVFPQTVSPFLAPLVYQIGAAGWTFNPTRTYGFDTVPLVHPITSARRTLAGTRVVRFNEVAADIIITEVWEAPSGLSAPISFFRRLYEYLVNTPTVAATGTDYVIWEPRDRTDRSWYVELLSLEVGSGGEGENRFDAIELRDRGGITEGGSIANAIDDLAPAGGSGVLDREMRLRFKIVAEVI